MSPDKLRNEAFAILPKILSNENCSGAIDRVWNLFEDISNGAVHREIPTSWKGSAYPPEGKFNDFGAEWLLGDLLEVLAKKVFEPFF